MSFLLAGEKRKTTIFIKRRKVVNDNKEFFSISYGVSMTKEVYEENSGYWIHYYV